MASADNVRSTALSLIGDGVGADTTATLYTSESRVSPAHAILTTRFSSVYQSPSSPIHAKIPVSPLKFIKRIEFKSHLQLISPTSALGILDIDEGNNII